MRDLGMNDTAKIFIYIEFSGNGLPKEKINELWENCDIYFSMRGESFFEFKSGKKKRDDDYCNIRFEFSQIELTINDILMTFLMEQKDRINMISKKYPNIIKKIHLCIYPDSEQYTYDFSIELLKLLSILNIKIGFTVLQL